MKKIIRTLIIVCMLFLALTLTFTACNEEEDDTHVHKFGEWVNLKDSTCTENGIKFRKCAICGEEEFDYVNPTHKWIEATCLSAKKCELCGKTEGSLVDHEYVNGTCIFCGKFNYQEGLTYDGSPVTIRFYSTMGMGLAFIEEFQKMYPNITVEHTQPGGYDEIRNTIRAEITVNKQPNIAFCYPDHVAVYNRSGKVITLDDFISSTATVNRADGTTEPLGLTRAQIDDIIEGFYNEGKQFGDEYMYTLPFSKSTEVLYYNATFFEEHDLEVPTTWDELEEVCRKIKAIDPNCIPLGYDSEANWFITMCEQYNSPYTSASGEHYLFDNQTNRDFVKKFAQWHSDGLVTTKALNGAAYTSGLFVEQKSYMSIASSVGATHQRPTPVDGVYPFEVGIAPIPQVDPANNPRVISQGPSLCMFDCGDAQENIATWLFMKFLVTNVNLQAAFADASGYVPVLKSVSEVPAFAAKLEAANGGNNIAYLSMKVCLEQADYYYTSPAFNGSSTARDQVGYLMQAVMAGYTEASKNGSVDALIDKAFKDAINECKTRL